MDKLTERLTKEYMRKLDGLSYQMSARLTGGYGGARRAKGKGGSMEFSDFRAYTEGDDMRRIDWNSFARQGKLSVKLFTEEKQATANLFVDISASMGFGDGAKGLYAKMLAASLGYIFMKNTDRVNLFAMQEDLRADKGGLSSKGRFFELTDALEKLSFGGETRLAGALAQSRAHRLGSGISFVFSDFFSADGFEAGALSLAQAGQAVVLVLLLSAEEARPVLDGPMRLVDAETKQVRDIRVTAEVLARYTEAVEAHKARMQGFCRRHGFGFIYADTDMHPLETVGGLVL